MIDRSKYRAPSLAVNKAASQEAEKILNQNQNNRGDYLKIDEGFNVFRLFPPHNLGEPVFQVKVVYWLECRVPKRNADGEVIEGEFEWRRKPIFDSRIHGGTPKDIIDEYIKFTKAQIFENQNSDDVKKKLAPINGWRDKSGKWNPGLMPSTSYVAYATKGDITVANLGRLELFASDKAELERLNIDEVTGEPLETDIWSDPDTGVQFTLNKVQEETKNGKRWVSRIAKRVMSVQGVKDMNEAWKKFLDSQKIPDDVLEHWSKMQPLSEQFKGAYKRSDFNFAVEGLQRFDETHGFGTFENDEFLDVLKEIDSYYPDVDEEEVEEKEETTSTETLAFDEMTRDELKAFIKENGLGIKVFKSTTTEDLAAKVEDAWNAKQNASASESEEEEEEDTDDDASPRAYDDATAKPGRKTKDSVMAGAERESVEKEAVEEKLPWEEGKQDAPAMTKEQTAAERAAALRARLAKK